MRTNILLLIIIFFLKISITNQCSSNCLYCKDDTICTKCANIYVLVGTSQFMPNNTITCKRSSTLTVAHYKNEDGVLYPCTNDDYGYLKNNITVCYRKDKLGINNYYTVDYKHYYPCDSNDNDNGHSVTGVPNCNQCKLEATGLKCLYCEYNYAFQDGVHTECISKDVLSSDHTLYKEDENNYRSCSIISNCVECTSRHTCTKCDTNYILKNYKRDECVLESSITNRDEFYQEGNVLYSCGLNGGVSHCKKCVDKTQCKECFTDYAILDDDSSKCVKKTELTNNLYYTLDSGIKYYSCSNYDNVHSDNKHCLQCDFSDSTNFKCLKCQTGYYFLEDQGSNCFEQNSINNQYYKYNSTFYKKCSSAINGCDTCENSKKCLTCSDSDFGILDRDYSLCQDISQGLTDNTIFSEDGFYYTCEKEIEGCLKCSDRNQCTEPISDEYCLLGGGSTVYKLNSESDIYYRLNSGTGDYNCHDCSDIFPDSNCYLCNSEANCIKCNEGYALKDKAGCEPIVALENDDEYFSDDNNINFYKCGDTTLSQYAISDCKKCEFSLEKMENKCTSCDNGKIILDDNDNICIDLSTSIQTQIDNEKIVANDLGTHYYTCNKLFDNCDTCLINECSTCKNNYAFLDNDKTICYSKDNFVNGHYFTDDGGINYYSCLANCLECNDDSSCITCDEGYELNDLNNKCDLILTTEEEIRENCVFRTINIDDDINDIDTTINDIVQGYFYNFREEKNTLLKYINQEDEYTIIIFKNYQCSLYLYEKDNSLKIDTSEIIQELKQYSYSKEIIQLIFLYKNHTGIKFYENSDGESIDINAICPSCINKKYKINYNYGNKIEEELGPKYAELVKENNIDIFDEYSPYFQDFCKNLQISGIDIPLNQRLYLLYKGSSSYNLGDTSKGDLYACNVNCTFLENNAEALTSECECDVNYDIETLINTANEIKEMNSEIKTEKKEIKEDYNFLDNSNDAFNMFTCTKDAFIGSNIKSNPGFYTVTIGMATQAIFFIVLMCKSRITSFAKLLILANPPKSQKAPIKGTSKRIVKKISNNDYFLPAPEEIKNQYNYVNRETNTIIPSSTIPIRETSNIDSANSDNDNDSDNDNGEIDHQRMNIYKGKKLNLNIEQDKNEDYKYYPIIKFMKFDVNVYRDIGYTYEQKDIKELKKVYKGIKMIKYNLLFKKEKNKILPIIYKPLLIDFLPFKYAQYYDKRSLGDLYKYFLYLRHPIINLFINENNISQNFIPFSTKAIKIIFCGILILFFNSLLITQKYLYDKFNYFNEKFDFKNMQLDDDIAYSEKIKYGIAHNFGNIFATYFIVLIIDIVISLVLSVRFRIKNLLDEFYEIDSGKNDVINKDKIEQKNFEKELLKVSDLKNVYLYTVLVFFGLLIAFFIYIINFCYSYKAENPDLFLSSLFSFIFYILFPFITNFFIAASRYISLKENCECLFNFSKILIEI